MRRSAGTALILALLVLAGCGQVAQKAVEQATGVQTNQQGDTVTIKGKDGQSLVISSQVPDELKNFPVPQGFKFDGSGSMSTGGDQLAVGNWTGTGSLQTVVDFYRTTLPGQGWKEDSSFVSPDSGMLSFSKGEADGVTITTNKEGESVTISVLMGKTSQKPAASSSQAAPGAGTAEQPARSGTSTGSVQVTSGSLPDELKAMPVPSGFAVVPDSMLRHSQGGKFVSALASWSGKSSVKEVGQFYQKELVAKGWVEEQYAETEDGVYATFVDEKAKLRLLVSVNQADDGTEIVLNVTAE